MSKKYSYELKLTVVTDYLEGTFGYKTLANKYNISHSSLIKTWVNNYRMNGTDGLKRKKGKTTYPLDFKLNVLHFKQSTGAS